MIKGSDQSSMSDPQRPPDLPRRVNPKPVVSQRPPSERVPQSQAEPTRMHQAQPTQSARRPPPPPPEVHSGLVVPWWGFVLVILAVAGITAGLWGLALMARNNESVVGIGATPTPYIIVVVPSPTLGLPSGQTTPTVPVIVPTQSETNPTVPVVEPTSPSGTLPIAIGCTVEVFGTEGFGVAVRQGPGRTYSFFYVAQDGQIFQVLEGPQEADGYRWWKVIDPQDSNNEGWVAQDFIQPIDPCS